MHRVRSTYRSRFLNTSNTHCELRQLAAAASSTIKAISLETLRTTMHASVHRYRHSQTAWLLGSTWKKSLSDRCFQNTDRNVTAPMFSLEQELSRSATVSSIAWQTAKIVEPIRIIEISSVRLLRAVEKMSPFSMPERINRELRNARFGLLPRAVRRP